MAKYLIPLSEIARAMNLTRQRVHQLVTRGQLEMTRDGAAVVVKRYKNAASKGVIHQFRVDEMGRASDEPPAPLSAPEVND